MAAQSEPAHVFFNDLAKKSAVVGDENAHVFYIFRNPVRAGVRLSIRNVKGKSEVKGAAPAEFALNA
ncbi:MAG: hypothetical protein ACD_47C00067G0003 [uncultured bacterium]|nr:MAG: hypothetical protein ACD_47C00067G0003 [uncultured bacterium]